MEQTVGRYQLKKRLAAGGMGEVYLAAQAGPEGFAKIVALKRMLPNMAAERELVTLFLHEARLVAKLSHRGIAQVIELGEDREGYFAALEFVPGPSVAVLVDRLRANNEKLPPAMALDIAAQVADALGYAHAATNTDGTPLKIVHRDVSPQNILLSVTGDVKLIDFGVAKSTAQHHATSDGGIKGKLAYMSPEQIRGQPLDGRSDLFSLGIVLYEMLTGTNPFLRADPVATLLAIQNEHAAQLFRVDPRLGMCDALFRKLLAKLPAERFRDGHELHDALNVLKSRFPPAPKRLGSFVHERFGREVAELTRCLGEVPSVVPLRDVVSGPLHPEPASATADVPAHPDVPLDSTLVKDRGLESLAAPVVPPPSSGSVPVIKLPTLPRQSTTEARAFLGQSKLPAAPALGSPVQAPEAGKGAGVLALKATPNGAALNGAQSMGAPVNGALALAVCPRPPEAPAPKPVLAAAPPLEHSPRPPRAVTPRPAATPRPPEKDGDSLRTLAVLMSLATFVAGGYGVYSYVRRVDTAIEEITVAPAREREAKISAVRRLISQEASPAKADYYRGRLELVEGRPSMAVSFFRSAINAGESGAIRGLVDMIGEGSCDARAVAAQAAGELKLDDARSALERLASSGSSGDTGAPIVGGCDSRKAAEDALRRLRRP